MEKQTKLKHLKIKCHKFIMLRILEKFSLDKMSHLPFQVFIILFQVNFHTLYTNQIKKNTVKRKQMEIIRNLNCSFLEKGSARFVPLLSPKNTHEARLNDPHFCNLS